MLILICVLYREALKKRPKLGICQTWGTTPPPPTEGFGQIMFIFYGIFIVQWILGKLLK